MPEQNVPNKSAFFSDSIFWIEVEKVHPNPYQPRKEFDEARLKDLAESIRMYGILQPLVVTRREFTKPDGGLGVDYELISGERRLRASKIAGLAQVPALIRNGEEDERIKLELAIIENLQREDLNPVDRARAFQRLVDEFGFKHVQIGQKVGKSREYVSNSLRLLMLPAEMLEALSQGKISEGHSRPLMMLNDRPEEQTTLFREIMLKKLTVREAEGIGRRVAYDKVRKKDRAFDPELIEIEEKLTESLGTRVQIELRAAEKDGGTGGGRIHIDFFSNDDLHSLLDLMSKAKNAPKVAVSSQLPSDASPSTATAAAVASQSAPSAPTASPTISASEITSAIIAPIDDRSAAEKSAAENSDQDDDLYSVKNFVV